MWKRILALSLFAVCAFAADVSGTWQVSVQTNQGSGTPLMDLQQQGEKLTGTFHSQILGDVKLSGTVKGSAIEFAMSGDVGGQTLAVSFKGTVESATTMKGTAVYEGVDSNATWTATKK
jgi:hypothetical protein